MTTDRSQVSHPKLMFGLTITKVSKNQSLLLLAEPTSVSTKPSVLVFSVTLIKDTNNQPLNCLIEHLGEEEFLAKHQNSIRLTSLICLCSNLDFQKRLHIIYMTGDLTICTVMFSLVNNSHPKFNISVNYPKEGSE